MRHIYLYLLIHLISKLGINFHEVQGMILKTEEEGAAHIPSISSQFFDEDSKELIDLSTKISQGGKGITQQENLKELQVYRSKAAKEFWDKIKIQCHADFSEKDLYKSLIREINEILISEEETWAERLATLFEKTKKNGPQQIVLFQVLKQLPDTYCLPYKAVFAVWKELQEMWYNPQAPETGNPLWREQATLALDTYGEPMIAQIRSLSPEAEKNFVDFVTKQGQMGVGALHLTDNWCQEDQKLLFSFWIANRQLYSRLKRLPGLQHVLETQIVQTQLIQVVQNFPDELYSVKDTLEKWARLTLISQSKIVLDYIKKMRGSNFYASSFYSAQHLVQPYGLKMDIRQFSPQDQLNIIEFWSSHVHVFLKMKKLGETGSLEKVIADMVERNYLETSGIMKQFLIDVDGEDGAQKDPILTRFLKYFAGKTLKQEPVQTQSQEVVGTQSSEAVVTPQQEAVKTPKEEALKTQTQVAIGTSKQEAV